MFANVPFQLDEQRRWTALGYTQIRKDGRLLLFQDGTTLDSDLLYRSAVIRSLYNGLNRRRSGLSTTSRRSRADPAMVVHGCLSLVLRSGLGELQEWRRVFPGDAPAEATEP